MKLGYIAAGLVRVVFFRQFIELRLDLLLGRILRQHEGVIVAALGPRGISSAGGETA